MNPVKCTGGIGRVADDDTIGSIWSDAELDAIVSDYFSMLGDELAGRPYVKLHHSAALMQAIGRTHRSVEFKHQNISAVLDELGLPWIFGYKPKRNYQNSIFDAIDRYLSGHRETLYVQPTASTILRVEEQPQGIFVSMPEPGKEPKRPRELERLVRKFDPVERDFRNRALGRAGEEFVLDVERKRLIGEERGDLARKVRWISEEDGDGAGFDILSFDAGGTERLIEVKTTNGTARTPFFLTRVEHEIAHERANTWHLYRVHRFAQQPQIFSVRPPLDETLRLDPESWRARLA
jgi:hypothetical protein